MTISHKKIPEAAWQLMVKALAAEESLHRPLRAWQDHGPAIYARKHAPTLRIGGGRSNQREAASYLRSELIERGLMLPTGFLTPAGKRLARSRVWQFTPSELRLAVRRMLAAIDRNDTLDDDDEASRWVPEMLITGRYWDVQNELLQKCFRPWLCDGLLDCGSDVPGSAFYTVGNAEGRSLLKLASNIIDRSIEFDDDLFEIYDAETQRVWNAAIADYSTYSEIGPAPLALSTLRSGRDELANGDRIKGLKPIFELSDDCKVHEGNGRA